MKLWEGRTSGIINGAADAFMASLSFDCRLFREDIEGSIAHVRMLGKCGIVPPAEAASIIAELGAILDEYDRGEFAFQPGDEDVHTAIERALTERLGPLGKKLHTARSRNDQVALDMRLYCRKVLRDLIDMLRSVQEALVDQAEANVSTLMPGFTHTQHAQPVTLGHHLMAYFWMFERDVTRLRHCLEEVDVMPLGSGALAGTTHPIDRDFVAAELGFSRVSENSLDTVSDRDFIIDIIAACSVIMMHLSRLSEEMVLWATSEFKFVKIADEFTTGSSIMPQKKNPDAAELIRGKSGRVYGDLVSVLVMMKGLPLSYNRDMQEDKERLFDAVDTVMGSLEVMAPMVKTAQYSENEMWARAHEGYTTATDVADYLVRKGVPFREAYRLSAAVVNRCADAGIGLTDLSYEDWKSYSEVFEPDIMDSVDPVASVARRSIKGGPAPEEVKRQIGVARDLMKAR